MQWGIAKGLRPSPATTANTLSSGSQKILKIPLILSKKKLWNCETTSPIMSQAQLLTYLKLTDLKLGFLLNWNVTLMKDGIKRMVHNLKQSPHPQGVAFS